MTRQELQMLPMTRQELQMLDTQNRERLRIKQIQEMLTSIYRSVVLTATNDRGPLPTPTLYRHELTTTRDHIQPYNKDFLEENMPEILEKLRELFPDCLVTYKVMVGTRSGNRGGTTYTDLHPITTPSRYDTNSWISSFIIVDWS
jgi:hypothetical protein